MAARAFPIGGWWPFKKFAWEVFSPFENEDEESLASGSARSMQAAMDDADAALLGFIAEAERSRDAPAPS